MFKKIRNGLFEKKRNKNKKNVNKFNNNNQ